MWERKSFETKVLFQIKNNRDWSPNIKRVKAVVNGKTKRINVCTRCLRSGYVERAL